MSDKPDEKPKPKDLQELSVGATSIGFNNQLAFELLIRVANTLAASTLLPDVYKNNPVNCRVLAALAADLKINPQVLSWKLNIIHGKPSFSAEHLIEKFNESTKYDGMDYEWKGEECTDTWGCRGISTRIATNKVIKGPWVTIKMAKDEGWYGKNGSKWKTIPELMLMYRAATWMIRTHAPGVCKEAGLTTEEVIDIQDINEPHKGTAMHGETIEARAEEIKQSLKQQLGEIVDVDEKSNQP